jgi:hypothetical protein
LQRSDQTDVVGHLEKGWNQVGRTGECTGSVPADTLDVTVAECDTSAMDLSAIIYTRPSPKRLAGYTHAATLIERLVQNWCTI